jgi:hypothetical protein
MKNLPYYLVALGFGLLIFLGCQKGGLAGLNGKLVASKPTIAVNAVDSVLLVGASSSDSIHWSVTPSGFNTIGLNQNLAIITFSKPGTYTINATVTGKTPAVTTIHVTDAPVTPVTNTPTTPVITQSGAISLAGEQITLLSNYYKSKLGDTTYIYFTAQTTRLYGCGNSVINYTQKLDASNNFSLNFINIQQPDAASCTKTTSTIASGIIAFKQAPSNPYMTPGTYPLAVTLAGVTYTGNIIITSTDITFNWNYTSGVTIIPTHLSR